MTVTVKRSKLLSLLNGSLQTTWSGRPLTRLTGDLIKARMAVDDTARLVGSMSGGDESHTVTEWEVPGIGRGVLVIERTVLGKLMPAPEPPPVTRKPTLFDP